MKRQMRLFLGVAVTMGVLSPLALSQVTTPPPPKPEPEPAYTPPPQPVARPTPTPRPRPEGTSGPGTPVPEHEPLAQVGEDGKIVRLEGILDEIALQRNPLVSETKNDDINAMRVRRRVQAEKMVIDNLDLYREIESGVVNDIALAQFEEFQKVVQKIPPLVITGSLSSQLAEEGVLTRIQSQSTNQIVRMYNSAISEELEKEYPDNYLDYFMKFIINESLKDARFAYAGLVDELIANAHELSETATEADLTPAAKKVLDQAKKLAGKPGADEAVRESLDLLSLQDAQALLRAVRDRREDPDQPPLEKLDFHTAGTVVLNKGSEKTRMVQVHHADGTIGIVAYKGLKVGEEYYENGVKHIKGEEDEKSDD
ncbi:MAG: hypothetical protein R3B57_05570 [Phycisphaerales bacterium]